MSNVQQKKLFSFLQKKCWWPPLPHGAMQRDRPAMRMDIPDTKLNQQRGRLSENHFNSLELKGWNVWMFGCPDIYIFLNGYLAFVKQPTVHRRVVSRVKVCGCSFLRLWHVTGDMWHVTCDMWHVRGDFFVLQKGLTSANKCQTIQKVQTIKEKKKYKKGTKMP